MGGVFLSGLSALMDLSCRLHWTVLYSHALCILVRSAYSDCDALGLLVLICPLCIYPGNPNPFHGRSRRSRSTHSRSFNNSIFVSEGALNR